MKLRILISTAIGALLLSAPILPAQNGPAPQNPTPCANCQSDGVPKKDGTGPGARKGNRTGPKDGSGPIHTAPNTGKGRRGGRR
jgi:hypothetical protein